MDFWTRKRQRTGDSPSTGTLASIFFISHRNYLSDFVQGNNNRTTTARPTVKVELVSTEQHVRNLSSGQYGIGMSHSLLDLYQSASPFLFVLRQSRKIVFSCGFATEIYHLPGLTHVDPSRADIKEEPPISDRFNLDMGEFYNVVDRRI